MIYILRDISPEHSYKEGCNCPAHLNSILPQHNQAKHENRFMGIFGNRFKPKGKQQESVEISIDSDDDYNFDVVGESFQRDHLVSLLKKHEVTTDGRDL